MNLEKKAEKEQQIWTEEEIVSMGFELISRAGSWFLYGLSNERYWLRRERVNDSWEYTLKYTGRQE